MAVVPPSTATAAPVMKELSSLSRKATTRDLRWVRHASKRQRGPIGLEQRG